MDPLCSPRWNVSQYEPADCDIDWINPKISEINLSHCRSARHKCPGLEPGPQRRESARRLFVPIITILLCSFSYLLSVLLSLCKVGRHMNDAGVLHLIRLHSFLNQKRTDRHNDLFETFLLINPNKGRKFLKRWKHFKTDWLFVEAHENNI
jgi:hypothetical protein